MAVELCQPWRHLMWPRLSVQSNRGESSRVESSWVESSTSHAARLRWSCRRSLTSASRQAATCPMPPPGCCSSLASLIKLGRSDCHWEIALELSYSLCENSFTIFFFFFLFFQIVFSLLVSQPSIHLSFYPSIIEWPAHLRAKIVWIRWWAGNAENWGQSLARISGATEGALLACQKLF